MLLDLGLTLVGLVLLLGAAYFLVQSAVTISLTLGVSRVIIGATAVAFGTSAPEFLVSLVAGLQGTPGVALGNILGSNVANVGLVIGVAAVIAPMRVHARLVRWEIPVLIAATVAMLVFGLAGVIARWEGAVMCAGLLVFVVLSPRLFPEAAAAIASEASEAGRVVQRDLRALLPQAGILLASIVGLAAGAQFTVEGATAVASTLGVSEFVIGVTVIAVGTSLPELATSGVAAWRREHDIAVANIVGSNIFNLLGVIGLTAAIVPLEVERSLYGFEMIALALSTLILIPLAWNFRISRVEGGVLLLAYAAFTVLVVARGSV
jgi:cation:H+ antiporter